jgi:uncharacterized surface protein with fasciclin (FAS1) repeats
MNQLSFFASTRRTAIAAAIALTLTACATTPDTSSLVYVIEKDPTLSTLSGLIEQAGLASTLRSEGPFTIFAPTNAAFKAVPAAVMTDLAKNPEKLKAVLTYHVVPGKVMAADVKNNSVATVNGAKVALYKAGDFVTVENAAVVQANRLASNGVLHTVDAVMLPPKK